jgi:hypothetical protein
LKDHILAAAEVDMRNQWGDARVRRPIAKLGQDIVSLAAGQSSFRDMGALFSALRMAHGEHHVFCLPRGCAPIERDDFYERLGLMARLAWALEKEK